MHLEGFEPRVHMVDVFSGCVRCAALISGRFISLFCEVPSQIAVHHAVMVNGQSLSGTIVELNCYRLWKYLPTMKVVQCIMLPAIHDTP